MTNTNQRRTRSHRVNWIQSWLPESICNALLGLHNINQIGRQIFLNMKPSNITTIGHPHLPPISPSVPSVRTGLSTLSENPSHVPPPVLPGNFSIGTLSKSPFHSTNRRDQGRYQTTGFINNRIVSARYNIATFFPKQLFAQFSKLANVYFAFIAGLQQVEGWSPTGQWTTLLPLILFISLAMAREAYDDWQRRKRDETENKEYTELLVGNKLDGVPAHWEFQQWEKIQVGNIVRVRKDKPVPADLILLRTSLDKGLCYIQTSQLDGESNLKQRAAIEQIHSQLSTLEEIANFKGTIRTIIRNKNYLFTFI